MIFVKQNCQKTVVKIKKREKIQDQRPKKEFLIRPPLGGLGADRREKK